MPLADLARSALADYDVPVTSVTRLRKGWNTNFRVDGPTGRHVLRIHRADGPAPEMVRAELAWLTAIRRDTDMVVPEPIPTRSGTPSPTHTLYRWVDGKFQDKSLTPAHLHKVGVFTARLQQHGLTMPALTRDRVDTVTDQAHNWWQTCVPRRRAHWLRLP